MKVIIAGDRNCIDYSLLEKAIMKSKFDITEVVSGGARGVDSVGESWAKVNKVSVKVFAADWNNIKTKNARIKTRQNPWTKRKEKYNANAGFDRNQQMADYADALIALQPNGPTDGTQDMIRRAKAKGLKIYIYEKSDDEYSYKF
jgi:hypothetical protein